MATYLLIHGAWSGGLSWRPIAAKLRERGHVAFAPSLTGLGDRLHLGGPETDLTTHVTDLVTLVEYEDLRDFVLVGHSYGGMVITGAADRLTDRVAHLVYFDAFLPEDGQSCYDLGGAPGRPVRDGWRVERRTDGGVLPPGSSPYQPLGTLTEKVQLSMPLEERPFSRTYVKAGLEPRVRAEPSSGAFWRAADRVRDDPRWRYIELPGNHRLQRELPETVVGILLDLVRDESPV